MTYSRPFPVFFLTAFFTLVFCCLPQYIYAAAPQAVSFVPNSGTGLSYSPTIVFADADGSSDLNDLGVLINTQVDGRSSCWVNYNAPSNMISLASDDTSTWSAAVLGSVRTLSNSQCSVSAQASSFGAAGNQGTLTLAITFSPAFTGNKNVYMQESDKQGNATSFTLMGSWNVQQSAVSGIPIIQPTSVSISSNILTGTHWPSASDFPTLKNFVGLDFAVVTVDPNDPAALQNYFTAAQNTGIQLIVGAYPPPYILNPDGTTWSISAAGINFLNSLASHASMVKAVYVFNEPYWTNSTGSQTFSCGNMSAAQLRSLRNKIQSVWPGAKIYQDIGDPQFWSNVSCAGNKYTDQTGVADYVGIWYHPFSASGYAKTTGLSWLTSVVKFVENSMSPAVPIFDAQSFADSDPASVPGGAALMPNTSQLQDWNCSVRSILPSGSLISWYVWRQAPLYYDSLSAHPELWPYTTSSACANSVASPPVVTPPVSPVVPPVTPSAPTPPPYNTPSSGSSGVSTAPIISGGGNIGGGSSAISTVNTSFVSLPSASRSSSTISATVSTNGFGISQSILTTANVHVRNTAGGASVDVKKAGTVGTIIGGPIVASGYVWWDIDYASGADGWTAQNFIANNQRVSSIPSISSTPVVSMYAPVSKGMRSNSVLLVQQALYRLNYLSASSLTGFFGSITQSAIQRFQCDKGIVCSGTPTSTGYGNGGPKTVNALSTAIKGLH